MHILIVEDDKLSALVLVKHLKESDLNAQMEVASSISEARRVLKEKQFDLIFLDIHLQDGKSIEIINELPNNQRVIFVTSDATYAVNAFEYNAIDYMIKPVSKERFDKSMARIKEQDDAEGYIVIRADYNFHKIKASEILFVKANGDYITLTTINDSYTFHARLKNFIHKLPEGDFMQCHRSYIVNLRRIKQMDKSTLVLEGNEIPVSSSYKKELNNAFNEI